MTLRTVGAVEQLGDLGVGPGGGLERRRRQAGGTVIRARDLAVDLHRDLDGVVDQQRRVGHGERLVGQRRPWPRRAHSSSATCGASGASISTSGSATSRGTPPSGYRAVRWLFSSVRRAIAVLNRSVSMPSRTAAIVRCSTRRSRRRRASSDDARLAGVLVDDVAPDPLQEAEHADDGLGLPRPAQVERALNIS